MGKFEHCRWHSLFDVVSGFVLAVVALLLVRTWLLQGLLAPVYVSGSSMAPTLRGPHREAVCENCESRFAVGAAEWPDDGQVQCPGCGHVSSEDAVAAERSGERIWINLSAYQFRPPRRWEVVVFRCPESASRLCVKRVVGLPGESVQVQQGDVIVDGQLVRKSLTDQRSLRQKVHRVGEGPSRWATNDSAQRNSGWRKDGDRWSFSQYSRPSQTDRKAATEQVADESRIEWLTYRHLNDRPITDDMFYNQNVSRRLNTIRDVMLTCRIRLASESRGVLFLAATDGRDRFQIELEPASAEVRLSRNGQLVCVETASMKRLATRRTTQLEFSLFDRQVLVALDGQTVLAWPYESSEQPDRPTAQPVSIGASGLELILEDLTLWRDVYYTPPAVRGIGQPLRLGPDEYFVLGDNSPISRDSRYWRPSALPAKLLLGKPL